MAHAPDHDASRQRPRQDEEAPKAGVGRRPDPAAQPEIPPPESAPDSVMESPPASEQMQG